MLSVPFSLPANGYGASALRILDAAEECFGEYGIDAVSLRQIAIAAGQANTAAVQYHFGSKAGLMNAIFLHRLPDIEQRRQQLSQALDPQQRRQARALLRIIFQPIWEVRNRHGRPGYALFLRRLNNVRAMPVGWTMASQAAPVTLATVASLRDCMPGISAAAQDFRILLIATTMFDAFWKADQIRADAASSALLISTALDMGCAAVQCAADVGDDLWL